MTFLAHTFNFFFQQQPFSPLSCRLQLTINQCLKRFLSYSSLTSLQSLTLRKTTQVGNNKESNVIISRKKNHKYKLNIW